MRLTSRYYIGLFHALVACFMLCPNITLAQLYDFQRFTVENGLSQSQILSLHQIHTGELWMGTNQGGINKFNGSEFSYLTKSDGLTDNVVYAIAQERSGRILVGTNNGLNIIEGLRIDTLNIEKGLPHKGVTSILLAGSGQIWLGTGKGVANLIGDTIVPFMYDSLLANSTTLNIRQAKDGSLWFCTVQNGLFIWTGTTMHHIDTRNGLNHNYVYDVMPTSVSEAWIYGYDGLFEMKNGRVERIQVDLVPLKTSFQGYCQDKAGNIWIGTSVGVLKYRDGKFKRLSTENGLVNNNIWKILQDREGNLWFGSKSNGVSKLNSERFKLYISEDDIPNPIVNAVFRDSDSRLWLGTKKGISRWTDDEREMFEAKDGLSSEVIRDFDQDGQGRIYIATNFGLTVFSNDRFEPHTSEVTNLNSCWDVYVDGDVVWLGTSNGPAIFKNGKITQPFGAAKFNQPVFDAVRRGGDVWFAFDDGVLRFDGSKFHHLTAKNGFFDGRTRSITLGPNGDLWFGTNNGVYRYNGVSCINYGVKDRLISDAVYSLKFDHEGSLWVGQSKGLSRLLFDGNELEDVIVYGKEQGFLGLECSTNSIWMDDDRKIWVGGSNGLVEYDPLLDKGAHFKPLTRLTDIKLFSQKADWLAFCDSITPAGLPVNLQLPYDKNHLTFEFSGVSLTSPGSINYSYILEGFDDDWQPITNNNSAKYPNIPPGTYTFKVRAGFGDELWKNQPVSFRFSVRPPFYKTSWFYLLCLLVALGIAYSYYSIRRANIQITEQNQKIESQKEVIETKNRQMVDSINYASTIQSATLPSEEQWKALLPDSFVLFRPKDIVSGDFYWLANRGDDIYFSAIDCTGHGVPGALMSIVGYNGLNQAITEHNLHRPAKILQYLSQSVNESLRKSERDDYLRDGMDIALCKLNFKTMSLEFAGAYNPLVVVRNGEIILTPGDRIAIGNMDSGSKPFTNHELKLEKGDCIYVFSDGYADQFGGEDGKKMKSAIMRQRLLEFSSFPMKDQHRKLLEHLKEWQGNLEQVDDICLIGVRV